jgi:hypothetical protein
MVDLRNGLGRETAEEESERWERETIWVGILILVGIEERIGELLGEKMKCEGIREDRDREIDAIGGFFTTS